MPIKLGNKEDGDDFFDREREREDLWRHLEGNHVVLSGPRRLGKTSLLQRLADEAAGHGLVARLVDVGGDDTATKFIDTLDHALPDKTIAGHLQAVGKAAADRMSRLRKFEVPLPGDFGGGIEIQAPPEAAWSSAARRLQQRLSPVAQDEAVVEVSRQPMTSQQGVESDRTREQEAAGEPALLPPRAQPGEQAHGVSRVPRQGLLQEDRDLVDEQQHRDDWRRNHAR